MYLLDTCVVSDFVKGDENTLKTLKSKSPFQIKISSITAYELQYGLLKNPHLRPAISNAVLGFLSDVEVLSFDSGHSGIAARIRVALERLGKPIGAYDILIAAIAISHNLSLVTANTGEFSRIQDLKLENWRTI